MKTKIVGFSLFLALVGCNYVQSNSLPLDSQENTGLTADQVDFKVVMDQVLSQRCTTCHSEAGGNRGDINLETYQNVFAVLAKVRDEVVGKTMPPRRAPQLTDAQVQTLVAWIDAGAPENLAGTAPIPPTQPPAATNTPTSTPPVIPAPVATTYEMVYKQVIQPSCLKCHSGQGSGDVNLETYQNLVANKDEVRKDIESGRMPRRSKLTDQQKKLILDWLDAGAHQFGPTPADLAQEQNPTGEQK